MAHAAPADDAAQILAAAGVKGGLVVHLGCGDGRLTAALRASDAYLVQGLDADAKNIEAARKTIRAAGLYGPVSADRWTGDRLPYIENLVNLVVVSDSACRIPMAEVTRVLAPGGAAYVRGADGRWTKTVKPRPKDIDEWTHYLHDPGNNAVAHDAVVGPPRHLQWVGSPAWTRNHDNMSGFNAMVSAGGRVFYVVDEGIRAQVELPPKWVLVGRDAFNGTVLWKRPLDNWQIHLWPAKSGPAQLPRRLVAVGDTVYATLGLDSPVTALDAATGRTVRTYESTKGAEEILCPDGVLLALVNPKGSLRPWSTKPSYADLQTLRSEPDAWAWTNSPRTVVAVDAASGNVLWTATSPVVPMTLAADAAHVYFHDGEKVVCLDRSGGRVLWSSKPVPRADNIRSWFAPTLVAYQDVVLFAGAEKMVRHAGGNDTMTALSAATGEVLWTAPHPPSGYDSPEDLLIVDGLVWTAPMTNRRDSGQFTGRDVHTGQVKRTFASDNGDVMPHHRCHRARATDRFILASRTGIEYVDLAAQHWNRNDWVRGACLYGIMPANGLTYAPPQSCACYILAKLTGLNALAAESPSRQSPAEARPPGGEGLERGPAYDAAGPPAAPASGAGGDWPAFRHDAARSGFTTVSVPAELKCGWQADLGGVLSSPVVAGGKVFVASIDTHVVHALDERTGRPVWQYAAGGRVDSPPTVWQGRVLFGSADGYVYCLRAADGALAWRFRAAPADLRLVAWEQVESVWPVHGAVLVHDGLVHCVAGRSMFLDGGMRYLRIDAATGRLVSETLLDNRNPETGNPLDAHVKWPNLPVALPDVLSCDGKYVYMRSQRFDLSGVRTDVAAPANARDQAGDGAHLFATTGFLDGSWWHRTFWIYGKTAPGGAGGWYTPAFYAPTGRLMVCDDRRAYAFERLPQYYPRTPALEYHLFAAAKEPKIVAGGGGAESKTKANRAAPSHPAFDWSRQVPLLGRSMALAGTTLFVAGPPDLADEEQALTRLDAAETQQSLAAQAEAFEGKRGALLLAVAAADGKNLAAWRLPSMPVFDGMAAANGSLVLCASDGKVFRLAAEGQPLTPATDAVIKTPAPAARPGDGAVAADFQQLSQVRVTAAGLGWRVQSNPGKVGFALRQLETPLTKQATFKLRLHMIPRDASADPPRNGFFVFGETPDDEHLVKCGLRRASALIVHGPLLGGQAASAAVEAKIDAVVDLVVTVDLAAHKAAMTVCGRTVEAALPGELKNIKYIGYCTHGLASEFSRVEIGGQ